MDHHTFSSGTVSHIPADLHWKGTWDELKGRAKQIWGELTDDDLDVAEGACEELMGRIERRTGEALIHVRRQLFGNDHSF